MQSNRTLSGQLNDSDQNVIIGDAAKNGQQKVIVNYGTIDPALNAKNGSSIPTANDDMVEVETLEGYSKKRVTCKKVNMLTQLKMGSKTLFQPQLITLWPQGLNWLPAPITSPKRNKTALKQVLEKN